MKQQNQQTLTLRESLWLVALIAAVIGGIKTTGELSAACFIIMFCILCHAGSGNMKQPTLQPPTVS